MSFWCGLFFSFAKTRGEAQVYFLSTYLEEKKEQEGL